MPRGRKRKPNGEEADAGTAKDIQEEEPVIEDKKPFKSASAKPIRARAVKARTIKSVKEESDEEDEARPAAVPQKRQRARTVKAGKKEENAQKVKDTKQKRAVKVRANPAKIVKEESENASVALQRIAQVVNPIDEASDDSSDDEAQSKVESKLKHAHQSVGDDHDNEDEDDDDEDDLFEDVDITTKAGASAKFDKDEEEDEAKDDLNLTLEKAERLQLTKTGKKKQSVRAVHERAFCHYMSVIAMVAVGAWRNAWINDNKLHKILRKTMRKHATRLDKELAQLAQSKTTISLEFVEVMSRVMNYFNSRFKRTKPGLRKLGHRAVSQMDAAVDFESAAEQFVSKEDFFAQARKLEGSRDFGAQLFTGLLRAYHFKVRLVFSTQPLGFKFNEREEFNPAIVKEAKADAERRAAARDSKTLVEDDTEKSKTSKGLTKGTKDDAISLSDSESELSDLGSEFSVDHDLMDIDGEADVKQVIEQPVDDRPDHDLEYPIFWSEVYDASSDRWIAIDAMVKKVILVDDKGCKSLHPRGAKAERQKLTLGFVVAYDANMYAKDVTMRYASSWAKVKEVFLRADGKTNTRYDVNKILVRMGNPHRDETERREDDSLAIKEVKRPPPDEMPKSLADFKNSPKYILDKHLREKSAFRPGAQPIDTFTVGKGAKETTSLVYLREDVVPAKTIENYHKEGRRIKEGERPIKMIKARAVTTARLREHAAIMEETGEDHVLQGIYSIDQTEYIVPPPIKDGIIPKNAFGNADVFVESMVPKGATHLKLKGCAKIARKLEIEHAEAVVGFEFKKRGAIPVVLGVLVPDKDADRLEAAWHEAEELRIRKEDKKRTDAALKTWTKLLKGLRIRQRINAEYGIPQENNDTEDGEMFVPEPEKRRALPGLEQKDDDKSHVTQHKHDDDDDDDEMEDGGFVRE